MATKFIEYQDARLLIEGETILANNATLEIQSSLQPIKNITGSIIRYAPQEPIKGTLSFSHYCSGKLFDFLNPLTAIEHTGEPLEGSLAGITFSSGYIKSLNFSCEPFKPIVFNSEMDIYGELGVVNTDGDEDAYLKSLNSYPENTEIAHGLRSYVAGDDLGIDSTLSFTYSVTCDRNTSKTIGNELPYRVTKENVRIEMNVKGENLGSVLNYQGNYAEIQANIYDVYGDSTMFTLGCSGQVFKESLNVSSNSVLEGQISISQEYLTGKNLTW